MEMWSSIAIKENSIEIYKKKLDGKLPWDPSVLLLAMHSREVSSVCWREIFTCMFNEAVLTVGKMHSQHRHP